MNVIAHAPHPEHEPEPVDPAEYAACLDRLRAHALEILAMVEKAKRPCASCGEMFEPSPTGRKRIYCSTACRVSTHAARAKPADTRDPKRIREERNQRRRLRRASLAARAQAELAAPVAQPTDARCSQCNVNVSHTHTILCGSPGCPMALPAQPFVSIFAEGTLGPSIPPARPESAWTRAMRGDA